MDKSFALKYAELEEKHWWFRARRNILTTLLQNDIDWNNVDHLLEIGTSSGMNLYDIYRRFLYADQIHGVEPFAPNLDLANRRGKIKVYPGTAEELPDELDEYRYDVITMFDVLEHTEDDEAVLRYLYPRITDYGSLVLTVPAYMWLWGRQDEVSHHYRRYTMPLLKQRLENNGFKILYSTYFNTILFPAIAALRLASKLGADEKESDNFGDFNYGHPLLDKLFFLLFNLERYPLKFLKFPYGVSLYAHAVKV